MYNKTQIIQNVTQPLCHHKVPEFGGPIGMVVVMVLLAGVTVGFAIYMKRKGWMK